MSEHNLLERIAIDPEILDGKPVIRGTRLSVDYILALLARGASMDEILDEYEGLHLEDLRACMLFAAQAVKSASFFPLIARSA